MRFRVTTRRPSLYPPVRGAWRLLVAMLVTVACVWSLVLAPKPSFAEPWVAASAQQLQEPASQNAECGTAELCQEVTEREGSLPVAALAPVERPYLAPSCLHGSLVHLALAPPERPPRLRA